MKSLFHICLALLLLAGGLVALRDQPAPSETVRSVNMQACIDGYRALQAEVQSFREKTAGQEQALLAEDSVLRERQGELAILDPQSAEFQEALWQLESDKMMLERKQKRWQEQANLAFMRMQARAIKQIHEAAGELGRREGFSAVLVHPGEGPSLDRDLTGALELLSSTQVIWANDNHDVTSLVLQILNGQG